MVPVYVTSQDWAEEIWMSQWRNLKSLSFWPSKTCPLTHLARKVLTQRGMWWKLVKPLPWWVMVMTRIPLKYTIIIDIYIHTHLILYNKTMQYTLHSQIPKKKWVYEKRHIVCIPVNMHTYMRLFHFVFPVITRSPGRFAWPQRTSRNHRQVWCNCLSLARISHCPFDRIVSNCQYLLYNVHGWVHSQHTWVRVNKYRELRKQVVRKKTCIFKIQSHVILSSWGTKVRIFE